jgi:hypothetical protein
MKDFFAIICIVMWGSFLLSGVFLAIAAIIRRLLLPDVPIATIGVAAVYATAITVSTLGWLVCWLRESPN